MNSYEVLNVFLRLALCLMVIQCSELVKIHRSNCRRDAVFKATDRDKRLTLSQSSIFSIVSTAKLALCVQHCTSTFNCRSINYKQAQTENCQILEFDKSNASAVVENATGWVHYEPISMVRIPVSCRSLHFSLL